MTFETVCSVELVSRMTYPEREFLTGHLYGHPAPKRAVDPSNDGEVPVQRPACGHPFRSCHTRVSPRGDTNDVITELSGTWLIHKNILPSHARSVPPIRAEEPSDLHWRAMELPEHATRQHPGQL